MNDLRHDMPAARRSDPGDDLPPAAHRPLGTLGATLALILAMVGGAGAAEVPVAVTATGCEPMEITVPAGLVTFVITNRSSRALEWEILDGVLVVDERENIAPRFKSKLTTRLKPGTYEVTCGLLDNPRGKLIVTGAAPTKPSAADLIGVVAEYRVGNHAALSRLDDAATRLAAAASGDRTAAISAFVEARAAFLAAAPVHDLVGAPATTLAAELAEIERLLLAEPPGDIRPAVARLAAAIAAHGAAVKPLVAPADRLVAGTRSVAADLVVDAETASPAADQLALIDAERAAIERVVGLFAPHRAALGDAAATALDSALAALKAELGRHPGPIGGFADARTLPPERRAALTAAARELADRLAPLAGLVAP
jgi:hypothetical protein